MSDQYYDGDDGGEAPATQDQIAAAYEQAMQQGQQDYIEQGAAELVADHPQLAREENAEALVSNARRIAEQLGAEHLASDPGWWRAVHEGRLQPRDDRDPGDVIVDPGNGQGGRHVLPFG